MEVSITDGDLAELRRVNAGVNVIHRIRDLVWKHVGNKSVVFAAIDGDDVKLETGGADPIVVRKDLSGLADA